MTIWGFKFALNWLLLPVGAWFLRKYWVARKAGPWVRYLEHSTVRATRQFVFNQENMAFVASWHEFLNYPSLFKSKGLPEPKQPSELFSSMSLVRIERRERGFPWARTIERWLVTDDSSIKEDDGSMADKELHLRLRGMVLVAHVAKIELEDLTK